jgi:hypothetical protein
MKKMENFNDTISSFASQAYRSLPSVSRFRLSTPSEMIKKATIVAIPVILLLGVQRAQVVEGGLLSAWIAAAACVGVGLLSIPASGGLSAPLVMSCEAAFAAGLVLPLP